MGRNIHSKMIKRYENLDNVMKFIYNPIYMSVILICIVINIIFILNSFFMNIIPLLLFIPYIVTGIRNNLFLSSIVYHYHKIKR